MTLHKPMLGVIGLVTLLLAAPVKADTQERIDAGVKRAIEWLEADRDTVKLLKKAKAVLIFPDLVEMGFGVGGEFGEGALLIDGQTDAYYATSGKAYGLDFDVSYKAEVILFMRDDALQEMLKRRSWRPVEHGGARIVANSGDIRDALRAKVPIVGLTFIEKGLVGGLGMKGDRVTRVAR
ncbi:MAG: lipid-binding SYLF domain-containing protein [Bacteroidia bacterium]|jgi:lipid-binding SYLF domain-containing protein